MPGDEQAVAEDAATSDPRFILTSLAALVLFTGASIVWRAKAGYAQGVHRLKDPKLIANSYPDSQDQDTQSREKLTLTLSEPGADSVDNSDPNDSKESKRPKERRKRGKDPLKEILKGNKKGKTLQRLAKAMSAAEERAPTGLLPQTELMAESQDGSVCTSSRSSSIASRKSKPRTAPLASVDSTQEPEAVSDSSADPGGSGDGDSSVGAYFLASTAPPLSSFPSDPGFGTPKTERDLAHFPIPLLPSMPEFSRRQDRERDTAVEMENLPSVPDTPTVSVSASSSSTSRSGYTSDTQSHSTANTSPLPSRTQTTPTEQPTNDPSLLQPSQSMPPNISTHMSMPGGTSTPSPHPRKNTKLPNQTFQGPWDWDGQPSSANANTNANTTYNKPPRFRSKAKNPNAQGSALAALMPNSISYDAPFPIGGSSKTANASSSSNNSSPSLLPESASSSSGVPNPIFPTLNTPSASPLPSPAINGQFSLNGTSGSATSSLRSPTPSHSPQPSSSVSVQTQMASLRGALEAARMREEKSKQEVERLTKECETLKWRWNEDALAWRRLEIQLQAQANHLMHQLQAYAALFVSMSPPTSPLPGSTPSFSPPQPLPPQSSPFASPPATRATFPVPIQQVLAGMNAPPSPHSPFMYPNPNQQQKGQQQQSLFSLLFPAAVGGGGSGSGSGGGTPVSVSVSGSSSVGSLSPVLDSAPLWDRGRRPMRATRAQQAQGQAPGNADTTGSVDGGWMAEEDYLDTPSHDSSPEKNEPEHEGEEEEVEVNGLLADAILKRPGSLRVKSTSTSSGGSVASPGSEVVFTFPSLSNLGNVEPLRED